MNKKKGILLIAQLLFFACLMWLDRFTKELAVTYLKGQDDYVVWKNVFVLHYLENRGAAFGIFQNQKLFFILIAAVIVIFIVYALVKLPVEKHFDAARVLLVAIAAGAIGNMIDRAGEGYVVDFLYFTLINFPVFNVADIYVTVGTILFIILLLFFYKEEDFDYFKPGSKIVN